MKLKRIMSFSSSSELLLWYLRRGRESVIDGIARYPVWAALAWENVTDQHRRTTLGPFWLVVNYLLFAGTFILIFGHNSGTSLYPAYVASGLYVWLLLSEAITASVGLLRSEASYVKGTNLPLFVYVMRLSMQTLLRAAYSGTGWVFLMLILIQPSMLQWAYTLVGLLAIFCLLPALITVLSLLGAFFPDLQFIIANLMRLGLFLTPIIWLEGAGSGLRQVVHDFNPFTYLLMLVRVPMLEAHFPVDALIACAGMASLAWFLAILLLGALRDKVVFVL